MGVFGTHKAGDPAGALEQLLTDRLRVLGPDHPHTLTTRHNLARWRGQARSPGRRGLTKDVGDQDEKLSVNSRAGRALGRRRPSPAAPARFRAGTSASAAGASASPGSGQPVENPLAHHGAG